MTPTPTTGCPYTHCECGALYGAIRYHPSSGGRALCSVCFHALLPSPALPVVTVTDEMVERACEAYDGATDDGAASTADAAAMRAALVAALSAGGGDAWVSAKERMPEDGASVYFVRRGSDHVYAGSRMAIGGPGFAGTSGQPYFDHNVGDVTHWMPRPLPPPPIRGGSEA